MSKERFVGIDVSASTLAVSWVSATSDSELTVKQTVSGWRKIIRTVQEDAGLEPDEVVVAIEASGNYWLGVARYLASAGWCVKVVNPAQAHYFAKSYLRRDKSDRVDAQLLARMAQERHTELTTWTPPPPVYEALYQRLVQREQLLKVRHQLGCQLKDMQVRPLQIEAIVNRYEAYIAALQADIAALDREIKALLSDESEWQATARHLLSIKGVGPITAAWLLVATVNFATCESAEQLTAYVGLCPREYSSGTSIYRRPSIGMAGHQRLRDSLYMAALSAIRYNPVIRTYYERMLKRGKAKKVAVIASARKLLHICFALARKGEDWDPDYGITPITA